LRYLIRNIELDKMVATSAPLLDVPSVFPEIVLTITKVYLLVYEGITWPLVTIECILPYECSMSFSMSQAVGHFRDINGLLVSKYNNLSNVVSILFSLAYNNYHCNITTIYLSNCRNSTLSCYGLISSFILLYISKALEKKKGARKNSN
jgi:hypothetical protein